MSQNIYILDASVGVKWLFKERMFEQAAVFASRLAERRIKVVVPEIFYSEIASACLKLIRQSIVTEGEAISRLNMLYRCQLERYSDWELSDVAFDVSLQYGISVYDALYVVLAEIYVAPLVTADQKLFDALKDRFDFIEFLGDVVLN